MSKQRFAEFVVLSDEVVGTGGFYAMRRMRLANRREDGTVSPPYTVDNLVRPYGQDAVVVVLWHCDAAGVPHVLLRDGLRPPLYFARQPALAPLPEPPASPWSRELPAGIIEMTDHGEAGLRARAVAEVREEAGFEVTPEAVHLLGAGTFAAPGALIEKFYFCAVNVEPQAATALDGDGSPMEEGARTYWYTLAEAQAACLQGALCDAKTEIGLARFAASNIWMQARRRAR